MPPTSFTVKQGQYLAFVDHDSRLHGIPPAEADFRCFFKVTPPVVHQMIKTLHARGFIDRESGKARSITLRLSRAQLPDLAAHSGSGTPLLNAVTGIGVKRPGGTSASRREETSKHPRRAVKAATCSKPRRAQADCLDVLTGEEAAAVLHALLLKAHPALLPDARRVADSLLATVSVSEVAERVCADRQALELDDLDAGPHVGGHVEPSEAAWDAIEDVVAYLHDLERRVRLRREDEALQVCSGIVTGLYRAEHSGFELHQYAEDAPAELASRAVKVWRRRRRNFCFPRQFVEKFTPDWDWLGS